MAQFFLFVMGLFFSVGLLLSFSKFENYIELPKQDWECVETYEHYSDGYMTISLVGKTPINLYHPSSKSTECASYRLKEDKLSNLAKKEN